MSKWWRDLIFDLALCLKLVGRLIYLTMAPPVISHVADIVSQYIHMAAVMRIIECLLRYSIKKLTIPEQHFPHLIGLCICWVGLVPSKLSVRNKMMYFLSDSLISWKSKKKNQVFRSSTKVKYRAFCMLYRNLSLSSHIQWLHLMLTVLVPSGSPQT